MVSLFVVVGAVVVVIGVVVCCSQFVRCCSACFVCLLLPLLLSSLLSLL